MPSPSRPLYRIRQLFAALRPRLGQAAREETSAVLGEGLYRLFSSMSLRDQRHCLDVYRALRVGGCQDRDLLKAALLHDVGKGCMAGGVEVRLWHRVGYVVLAAVAPRLLERLAGGGGLAVLHHHPERGALLAKALAAPETVVQLIRHHEGRHWPDDRLRRLQAADDSC